MNFKIAPTIRGYKKAYLMSDVKSGLIVAAISIPIAMGYAQIAGLPPVYGLYASVLPVFIFSLISTSPQFVVGVDAAPAALVGSALSTMGIAGGSKEAMELVPILTLFTALWLFLFSFLQFGKLVKYISKPVMGGFISGISCTIILMQIPKLMGHATVTGELFSLLVGIYRVLDEIHWVSLGLGIGTILIIVASKKRFPQLPMSVVMIGVGVFLTKVYHIDQKYGVALLSAVESGFPKFATLCFGDWDYLLLVEETFSIAIVIMASSLLAEENFANRNGYTICKNTEIFGFACCNLVSALMGSCPINGSVSRTSMTQQFGGKSQVISVVSSMGMLCLLVGGTGFIQYLPIPVLTGIVMAALLGVIDLALPKRLFRESKMELLIYIGSFLGVLIFGTIIGVVIGIVLAFVDVLMRTIQSPRSFLGVIPDREGFHCLERCSGAHKIKNTVIYRFSGNLYFANIDIFKREILDACCEDTKYVIVDASGINDIDLSAADVFVEIYECLEKKNIRFFITEHLGELNDKLRKYGAVGLIEEGVVRRSISTALRDVHIYPPYEIEGNTKEHIQYVMEPENRSFNEFEWAYGNEAEHYMQEYVKNIIDNLTEEDTENILNGWYLEHNNSRHWHKLGHADEEIILYHLEMHIHELAEKMKKEELFIEEILETRRTIITERLQAENKEEYGQMEEAFMKLENRMKQEQPQLYEEIIQIRKQLCQKNVFKNNCRIF